jgi:hypothetical protein
MILRMTTTLTAMIDQKMWCNAKLHVLPPQVVVKVVEK